MQCIKEKYGSSYQEFARQKLIPVVGNICEPNLGMDIKSAQAIMDNVDVIIASAASTTLNDRLIAYIYIFPLRVDEWKFVSFCLKQRSMLILSDEIYKTRWNTELDEY